MIWSQGNTLTRCHKLHIEERNQQVEGHWGFTQTLDPKIVEEWETMCKSWEDDCVPKTSKNPYETEGLSESFNCFFEVVSNQRRFT